MASFVDAFAAADSDMTPVHRRVVRVGAAAAWLVAAALPLIGLAADNPNLTVQAAGPALIGTFMVVQILTGRENAYVSLIGSALVVMITYSLLGERDTLVPAAVALVILSALAMVFIESRVVLAMGIVFGLLLFAPHLWALTLGEAVTLGLGMALSFVTASVIFVAVRSAMARLQVRFQMLFEHSPTAVMEEDWSDAVAYVRSEYAGKPERVKQFLLAYPSVVRRAVSMAKVTRVNRAAVALFEAESDDDLLGPRRADKVTDDNLESFVDALVTLYESRSTFDHDVLSETLGGRPIWLQVRAVDTSETGSGSRILMGLADITHIKERNEAMSRLVRAKDEFIARVSHELRTPLTAVVGLTSELASMESLPPEEHRELLRLVSGQAAEMSYIVEDLLVAARAEIGTVAIDTTVVDLDRELRTTIDTLGSDVGELPVEVPSVYADAGRVRQILRNLLTNAERYGGSNRRVLAGGAEGRVWLEVRDDGEGVPEEMTEKIFDPYTTAHAGVTGSVGLGLSVARQLATMMGGSLDYRRESGETIFRLELPAAASSGRALASHISFV